MRRKMEATKPSAEKVIKDIRRITRKQYGAEEKIRIVLDGLRGEESIARRGQCAHADSRPDSRRARALLNLSQDELAEASGLARQSIKNIERGVTDPRLSTAMTIKTTLQKAGVQFLEPSDVAVGPGVALRTK